MSIVRYRLLLFLHPRTRGRKRVGEALERDPLPRVGEEAFVFPKYLKVSIAI